VLYEATIHVASLGPQIPPKHQRDLPRQNRPQPRGQFPLRGSAELIDLAVCGEECFLNDVRRVELALEASADLHAREKREVLGIRFEQPAQRCFITRAGLDQEELGVKAHNNSEVLVRCKNLEMPRASGLL
jgi:hypothetical protein